MLKKSLSVIALAAISLSSWAANTFIEMKTSSGDIEIELFNDRAPISAKNFEDYVTSNFYTGTIFHRVIPGFMIQGGGFNISMQEKPNNKAAIKNESYNGLHNKRGTLAMARTNQPNSATSQFFINLVDNSFLDRSAMNAGYAVFGRVTKGIEIVDKIAQVPTRNYGMHQNVPVTPVKINKVTIKEAPMNK